MNEPTRDRELEGRLRALYRREVDLATADLRTTPVAVANRVAGHLRPIAVGLSTLAVAAALLVALAFRPVSAPPLGFGANASGTPLSSGPALTNPGATPSASAAMVDGIPTTIEGEPVLTESAIADAVARLTDDGSFLIGGWFPAGGDYGPVCAALKPGPLSCVPYVLHYAEGSAASFRVYPPGASSDIASYSSAQPVVMRVHTHDPRCPTTLEGCASRLVLDAIVWLGPKA